MEKTVRIDLGTYARKIWKSTQLPGDAGWAQEQIGEQSCDLVATIDVELLRRMMGLKAMTSRSGKTKLQGGAIVISVASRRGTDVPKATASQR